MHAPTLELALEHCRRAIAGGSKSFSLAARLFPVRVRDAAILVYGWCRYCDDEIDGHADEGAWALSSRVARLRELTLAALLGRPQELPQFVAFAHVAREAGIPVHYPLELIEGMAMDARSERYATLVELERYCYRVAGTVGLMMTHVMGLNDEAALRNACDLGIAMQLTNICRDVREDAAIGRSYLPAALVAERGELGAVERLLDRAEEKYRSGRAGLRALPLSAAVAVAVALFVYREIGVVVRGRLRARGDRAWDRRAVVPSWRKSWCVARGLLEVARTLPARLVERRERVVIRRILELS